MEAPIPENHDGKCKVPWVDTASFVREGKNLLVIIDGEEITLPGGRVDVCLEGDKAKVHLYTTFEAGAVDVISAETGS
jgi:hypothetical protein